MSRISMYVAVAWAVAALSMTVMAQPYVVSRITDSRGASHDLFSGGHIYLFVHVSGPALDVDGDVLVVGSPMDVVSGVQSGSVSVFRRVGGRWVAEQKLVPSQAEGLDRFGTSVAVSGDMIAVGMPFDNVHGSSRQGSVRMYQWDGARWAYKAFLSSSVGAANARFGSSLALDGDVLVVGAFTAHVGLMEFAGRVAVFRRSGRHWIEEAQLADEDAGTNEGFGISVAVDGDVLVVGSWRDDPYNIFGDGSATVFRWNGTVWQEGQTLVPAAAETYSEFGRSVAIHDDVIVVGAWFGGFGDGRAVIFRHDGGSWLREQTLKGVNGQFLDAFGVSVSVSGDTVVVGAHGDSVGMFEEQGTATVFRWDGSSWTNEPKLFDLGGSAFDHFGTSVVVDGDTLACGSPFSEIGTHQDQGAVYVFEPEPVPWTDLGGGSVGSAGVPSLQGVGQLVGGTPYALTLTGAPSGAELLAWVSFSPRPFEAWGGTVFAHPFASQASFVADATGGFVGSAGWPPGLPSATKVWFQFLVADASTVHGITLSNGLLATTP